MHALTISFLQFCFPVWPSLSTIFIRSGIPGKVALAGDSNCQPCGVGFFQNKSGVSSCKACEAGREKIIRFGQQGVTTAGKPKKGESAKQKARRASFKARHAKNIKKGKMSAAYWADKVKW